MLKKPRTRIESMKGKDMADELRDFAKRNGIDLSLADLDETRRILKKLPTSLSEKTLERGPLEVLFNGNANAKILDFLSTFQEWDYSESDIAKNSGVNIRTVQRSIPVLEQLGLITRVSIVGRAKMYRLDVNSETGKTTDKLAHVLAKARIGNSSQTG